MIGTIAYNPIDQIGLVQDHSIPVAMTAAAALANVVLRTRQLLGAASQLLPSATVIAAPSADGWLKQFWELAGTKVPLKAISAAAPGDVMLTAAS